MKNLEDQYIEAACNCKESLAKSLCLQHQNYSYDYRWEGGALFRLCDLINEDNLTTLAHPNIVFQASHFRCPGTNLRVPDKGDWDYFNKEIFNKFRPPFNSERKVNIYFLETAFEEHQALKRVSIQTRPVKNSLVGQDFGPNVQRHHGSAVVGVVSAQGGEGIPAGVCVADLNRCVVFEVPNAHELFNVLSTINNEIKSDEVTIINCSYGLSPADITVNYESEMRKRDIRTQLINGRLDDVCRQNCQGALGQLKELAKKNVIVVSAAGNHPNVDARVASIINFCDSIEPMGNVITVGALDTSGLMHSCSCQNADIYAPGEYVTLHSGRVGGIAVNSGTSFSAPLVTSVLANLMTAKSDLTASEAISIVSENSRKEKRMLYIQPQEIYSEIASKIKTSRTNRTTINGRGSMQLGK